MITAGSLVLVMFAAPRGRANLRCFPLDPRLIRPGQVAHARERIVLALLPRGRAVVLDFYMRPVRVPVLWLLGGRAPCATPSVRSV